MTITGGATVSGGNTCGTTASIRWRRRAAAEGEIDTLIQNARLPGREDVVDVRVAGERIAAIGAGLAPGSCEAVIDAAGGTLLPGLHDHHIHLMSLAASLDSLRCGPPAIHSAGELAALLQQHDGEAGGEWLRGFAYHPCVAGDIDRDWLDRWIPHRPVRIQHRGGRLWVLNSAALALLGGSPETGPPMLERRDGRLTGRLYEGDAWLRTRLPGTTPDLARASAALAAYGVTGITDTTPGNGVSEWRLFREAQDDGRLLQRVRMMGGRQLDKCGDTPLMQRGEWKVHLLESGLPDPDELAADLAGAHGAGRCAAIHCVTLAELVFALSALQAAGVRAGDRIEHASVTSPELLPTLRELGLRVVTQPHFIAERGDQYREDVPAGELPWLYRCASFLAAGIPLAAGSDAPFGDPDPWRAMRAAVERTTASGSILSLSEALAPEQALQLYLSEPDTPGIDHRAIIPGRRADLCLLKRPWAEVRADLSSAHVSSTWVAGRLVYSAS